jgi:hypothetical protein
MLLLNYRDSIRYISNTTLLYLFVDSIRYISNTTLLYLFVKKIPLFDFYITIGESIVKISELTCVTGNVIDYYNPNIFHSLDMLFHQDR